jgi:hypothetical protein
MAMLCKFDRQQLRVFINSSSYTMGGACGAYGGGDRSAQVVGGET